MKAVSASGRDGLQRAAIRPLRLMQSCAAIRRDAPAYSECGHFPAAGNAVPFQLHAMPPMFCRKSRGNARPPLFVECVVECSKILLRSFSVVEIASLLSADALYDAHKFRTVSWDI